MGVHDLKQTMLSKYPRSKLSTSSPAEAAAGHWQYFTCEESNHRTTQHHYKESRSKLRGIKPKGNKGNNMKTIGTFNRRIALGLIVAIVMSVSSIIGADGNGGLKPLVLCAIMQELSKNMQTVTDAISREDWEQVAKTAPLIADHPQPPPEEKGRILSFLGFDASKFKGFDSQTHQAAKKLGEIAGTQDGYAIIETFAALQNSCLACHQSFRKPFKEHFYEQQ